ncbi:hypothetical protein Trydic_g3825 [Trypoxylus dichotomus]
MSPLKLHEHQNRCSHDKSPPVNRAVNADKSEYRPMSVPNYTRQHRMRGLFDLHRCLRELRYKMLIRTVSYAENSISRKKGYESSGRGLLECTEIKGLYQQEGNKNEGAKLFVYNSRMV